MTMDELKPGQSAFISAVGGDGALRHHLLDIWLKDYQIGVKPSTAYLYERQAKLYLRPELGSIPLESLKAIDPAILKAISEESTSW